MYIIILMIIIVIIIIIVKIIRYVFTVYLTYLHINMKIYVYMHVYFFCLFHFFRTHTLYHSDNWLWVFQELLEEVAGVILSGSRVLGL